MSIVYSIYITEPLSRNLDERVDPDETQWQRLEDLHRIDGHMQSLIEDLTDLLPPGYTIESTKETP